MTVTNRELERRQFLKTAVTAAAAAATLPALGGLNLLDSNGRLLALARGKGGYGPLVPTADLRDGVKRIALPEGFTYRSFSPAGQVMTDGKKVPLAHDGMGAFNTADGKFRLVRNHEDRNAAVLPPNTATSDPNAYDNRAGGGTTTLVVNPFTRQLEEHFLSLTGTTVNCAGGITPWNSWITCEETTATAGTNSWAKNHGYCFDVPADANATVPAVAIPSMGRFSHEAVAVDPRTMIVYETEDNGNNSGFYRFIPNTPGVLVDGGRLQMLAISGRPQYDTRTNQTRGASMPVTWVNVANPDPVGSAPSCFSQGFGLGGTRFARLEGCWHGNDAIYFAATSGGNAGVGQIFEFRPEGDGGTLTLIFESVGASQLDFPDNLAVSPQGSLLLCEDGDGDQYMRGVTLDGGILDFGLNLETDHEWAGAAFAEADPSWNDVKVRGNNRPLNSRWDRVTLFVNRQGSTSGTNPPSNPLNVGLTFAIWGPWGEGAL